MTAAIAALHDLRLGEPDVAGPLALFPVFGPEPRLDYRAFAEAATLGFTVKELEPASVNDVLAVNPLDTPVLLYEGEEIVGAQQDRTVDVSVLVGAGATVKVPVSCVEQGRWQSARHAEAFAPSPRAAFPALRAVKSRQARAAMAAGAEARADQVEVWQEVQEKAGRLGAESATGAMGDIFDTGGLDDLQGAFTRRDGQIGALACLAGRPVVLDLVSRSDVFAGLFRPLVRGYCLDALESPQAGGVPAPEPFLAALRAAAMRRRPGVGLGETLALAGRGLGGTGLAVGEELIALSVFAEERAEGRIGRPSRRR